MNNPAIAAMVDQFAAQVRVDPDFHGVIRVTFPELADMIADLTGGMAAAFEFAGDHRFTGTELAEMMRTVGTAFRDVAKTLGREPGP